MLIKKILKGQIEGLIRYVQLYVVRFYRLLKNYLKEINPQSLFGVCPPSLRLYNPKSLRKIS